MAWQVEEPQSLEAETAGAPVSVARAWIMTRGLWGLPGGEGGV